MYTLDLVSVIMPVYNAEQFLSNAVESVLGQTYTALELILINDQSTDQSDDIICEFLKRDNRIKYIRLDQNKGVANARNVGIEASQGQYIAFLDSDDFWDKQKLEKQIEFMKKINCGFSFTSCHVIDSSNQKIKADRIVPKKVSYRELLKGNVIPCLTVMLDKEYVETRDMLMPPIHHEDYATWLRILKSGITAYGMKEILASYRYTNISISSNKKKAAIWTWNILFKNQKLGIFRSMYYFIHYVYRSFKKYK